MTGGWCVYGIGNYPHDHYCNNPTYNFIILSFHTGSDRFAVITHSFTDQFLEFLRQRQQAVEAANQIAAEEEDMDDEDWEEESLGDRTEGDVTILQNLGGERQWRFFRPDPFQLGRSTTLQVHVQAHHTLQDVELQIVQHWPDLRNPAARWRLQIVHGSVEASVYLEAGHEAFHRGSEPWSPSWTSAHHVWISVLGCHTESVLWDTWTQSAFSPDERNFTHVSGCDRTWMSCASMLLKPEWESAWSLWRVHSSERGLYRGQWNQHF